MIRLRSALLATLLFAGCSGTSDPDAPVQFVAFETEASPTTYAPTLDGPLRAIAVAPSGTMTSFPDGLAISATFSRPMAALDPDGSAPAAGILTTDPPIAGTIQWDGSRTLVLRPDQSLTEATRYTVRVSAGLTANDGTELLSDVVWSFETPRPRVVRSVPGEGEPYADPKTALTIRFSQRIDAMQAAKFAGLFQDERPVRTRASAGGDSILVLTPVEPLASGTDYSIRIAEGLPGLAGPLGMLEPAQITFRTLGPPTVESIEQRRPWWQEPPADGKLQPERGLSLTFSNPVRFGALRSALRLVPEVEWPSGIEDRDDAVATVHDLPVTWAASTRYQLTIEGLSDVFDQPLRSVQRSLQTGSFTPSFAMAAGVLFIEADQTPALPVRATNIHRVRTGVVRITPDELVPLLRTYDDDHWYGDLEEGAPEPTPVEPSVWVPLDVPEDRPTAALVSLADHLIDGVGMLGVVVEAPDLKNRDAARRFSAIAVVTHLGVTAKFGPHNGLALVTELSTGAPVTGAAVELRDDRGAVQWSGTTGPDGRAEYPGWYALGTVPDNPWDRPKQFLTVRRGNDVTFASSLYNEGIEPYRFDVPFEWWPEPRPMAGSVFSDRGLYREGETGHFKAVLRSRTDGDWSAITDSVRVFVRSPRDQQVLDATLKPGPLGTIDWKWAIPRGADLGSYGIRVAFAADTAAVNRGPWERGDIASGQFLVQAFRTASFSVTARSAAPDYVAGDFFEGSVEGRYLFGAAMQQAPVRATLRREPTGFNPPGLPTFRFGTVDFDGGGLYSMLLDADTLLDSDGLLSRRVALAGNSVGSATRLTWEGTVESPDAQSFAGRREIVLHPALFYIGLKPATTFGQAGKNMEVDVVTVDPNGSSVAADLTVELVRRVWHSVREVGYDGRLRWRSELAEEPVAKRPLATRRGKAARVSFAIPQGGLYLIRATGHDLRGNLTRSETLFYAGGAGYVPWGRADEDRLEIVADKQAYRPGETARLLVQSPFESATALITIEREGIMHSEVRTLEGSTPEITIALDERHLPNVFVSIILLQGRTALPAAGGDPGAPAFRIGYVPIAVDPGVRHLSVDVEPNRPEVRPGEEVTVNLRLLDANGRGVPGEIAFSAADAGVVDLIGYRLPDPFGAFYGSRPLQVTTTETRARLVRQRNFGQKEEDEGGGGGDPDRQLRSDFRPLAHWAPRVVVDASGRASVTFRVPESLTTFRLMASAVSPGNRFGAGESQLIVTQPLVMQPMIPRFAREGDAFDAGVLVTNRSTEAAAIRVTASANGLSANSTLNADLTLEAGATGRVPFSWTTIAGADSARFTFDASMGAERDAMTIAFPIARAAIRRVEATTGSTADRIEEVLQWPADGLPGRGGLDVRIASTALVGLDGAAEYLFEYPYGCLEQQTSRVRPIVQARDLVAAFDLTVPGGGAVPLYAAWQDGLDAFWTGTGYALWQGGRTDHPFVGAYVLLTLADAVDAGLDVRRDLLARSIASVRDAARRVSDKPEYLPLDAWQDARAFMLFALARAGSPLETDTDALAAWYLARPDASIEGVSLVLRAIVASGSSALADRVPALLAGLRRHIRVEAGATYASAPRSNGYGWVFSSDTRATAYVLSALSAIPSDPDSRLLAEGMARSLLDRREHGRWETTQDNAAVLDALAAYRTAFEPADPDFTAAVRLAGETLLSSRFDGPTLAVATRHVAPDALRGDGVLSFEVTGSGRLHYSAALESWTDAPQPRLTQGLEIDRSMQRLDRTGQPVGPVLRGAEQRLASGDLVVVTLRLTSPTDRNYVVVDDPLPAGLETVNTEFATTSSAAAAAEGQDRWWGSYNHTEKRDDRVLLFADYLVRGEHVYRYVARATSVGTFDWPAVRAEAMYRPEVQGRSAGSRLRVDQ